MGGCMSDRTDLPGGINFYDGQGLRAGVAMQTQYGVEFLGGVFARGPTERVGLLYATKDDCGEQRQSARQAAINEVRVVSCKASAEWRSTSGGEWATLEKNQVLQQGHEISTDPEGEVVIAFADNSTVRIGPGTQIKVSSFFSEGGVVRAELLLKNGELSAKVKRSETTPSDFRIKTGAGHSGSVRGTTFSVFADTASRASVFSVSEGVVEVSSGQPGSTPVMVGAGREVEVVGKAVGAPATIGRAGARGGINRARATALVLSRIAKSRCATSTARGGGATAKAAPGGWNVTVKLVGTPKGASRWTVRERLVKPANAAAGRVAGNCRR
jgi:hypothetical protein